MKFSLLFKHEKEQLEKLREAHRFFFQNDNSQVGQMRRAMARSWWFGDRGVTVKMSGLILPQITT